MPSIVGQVSYPFKLLEKVGESKKDYMDKTKKPEFKHHSKYIHNHKTLKNHIKESKKFVSWVKENYKVKSIYQLEPHHHQAYIEMKENQGLKPGSIVAVENSLNALQRGMIKAAEQNNKEPVEFFRGRLYQNKEKPSDRSYSRQEIEKLQDKMPENIKNASILSTDLGLRSREAAEIRVEHIDLKKGRVYIPPKEKAQNMGVKSAQGITKGGRERKITIPNHVKPKLQKIIEGKDPKDKVIGLKQTTLRKGLSEACKATGIKSNGWHGFRHTFAREYFDRIATQKEKESLQKAIENRRNGNRVDKGISKQGFRDMKSKANMVVSELGHGKDRWEQIETYLS